MASNLNNAHLNMLTQQVRANDVQDELILTALSEIDRALFVDPSMKELAYADMQLPIGFGQVMFSPMQEGRFLAALALQDNETVIEIGTGTGYLTAVMAQLAKQLISVEIIDEIYQQAQHNCSAFNNIELHCLDATKSLPITERVDVIVVSSALVTVPELYLHQLKIGGRMLVITGKTPAMQVQIIKRVEERKWSTEILFETVITQMINTEVKPEFKF